MAVLFGPTDNWVWDPSFYYAQMRSPIIDGDLNLRGEVNTGGMEPGVTASGLTPSQWPVGAGLLWAPFFLLAHIITLVANPSVANGLSDVYIALVSGGSALYAALGLVFTYLTCRRFARRQFALVCVGLCLFATPLFFYTFRQPIMAHSTNFAVSAALFAFYIYAMELPDLQKHSGLVFGFLSGLCFITRWSGLLLVVFPASCFIAQMHSAMRAGNFSNARGVMTQICIFAVSFALTVSPQLSYWQRVYGVFIAQPMGAGGFVRGLIPINVVNIFAATNRGIVFWSPFLVLGLMGLVFVKNRGIQLAALIYLACHAILLGFWVQWQGGGGFGPRFFIEAMPPLALGFVLLMNRAARFGIGKSVLIVMIAGLIIHQAVITYAVEHGSDGWIDLGRYFGGQPLGAQWQIDAFLRLIQRPELWLAPRPFVGVERQTMLVNALSGVRNPLLYALTGMAALFVSVIIFLAGILRQKIAQIPIAVLAKAGMAYLLFWAVYILLLH